MTDTERMQSCKDAKKGNPEGSKDEPTKDYTYQPSKAEKEEEIDMPGWTLEQVRKAFMRPPGQDSCD